MTTLCNVTGTVRDRAGNALPGVVLIWQPSPLTYQGLDGDTLTADSITITAAAGGAVDFDIAPGTYSVTGTYADDDALGTSLRAISFEAAVPDQTSADLSDTIGQVITPVAPVYVTPPGGVLWFENRANFVSWVNGGNTVADGNVAQVTTGGATVNFIADSTAAITGIPTGWKPAAPATFWHFGAAGDGATDDTTALQNAFNSGYRIEQPGGNFYYSSTLTLPSGTDLDLTGSTLTKNGLFSPGIQNTNSEDNTQTDVGYRIIGMKHRQATTASRGYMLVLVNVQDVVIDKYDCVQIATTAATGAWSLFVSGDNISITEPYIDSRAGGLYADGIHVAYARDLNISDGTILAGDDAIAIYPPTGTNSRNGKNLAGGGIVVSNMLLYSEDANEIRIGAASAAQDAGDALANVVYDGVSIQNCRRAYGTKTDGRFIRLSDARTSGAINGQHKNIVIDGIAGDQPNVSVGITIQGNDDETDLANINHYNFDNVIIRNVELGGATSGAVMDAHGVERLKVHHFHFDRDATGSVSSLVDLKQCGKIEFSDGYMRPGNSGVSSSVINLETSQEALFRDIEVDSQSTYRAMNFRGNSTQAMDVRWIGGRVYNAQRAFDNSGGINLNDFYVYGTEVVATVSAVTTAAATVDGTHIYTPLA